MIPFQLSYSNYKPWEIDLIYIQMCESESIQWCLWNCHAYLCTLEPVMFKTLKEMHKYCLCCVCKGYV